MATKILPPVPNKYRTEAKAKPAPAEDAPAAIEAAVDDPYGPLNATRCPGCGSIDDDRHAYFGADWHRAGDMQLDATVKRTNPGPDAEMVCLDCAHRGTIQDFYDSWTAASAWKPTEEAESARPPAPRLAVVVDEPGDALAEDDEIEDEAPEDDEAVDEDAVSLVDGDDADMDGFELDPSEYFAEDE